MKQILTLIIIGLILGSGLISASEDTDDNERMNLWERIVEWFKGVFGSGDGDNENILANFDGKVEFHKSMSCGCCGIHSQYISGAGLDLEIINMDDVSPIKDSYNIPSELRSCHTIILGDYFVEGHMPKEAIEKLIIEKPDIAGIALPGMPEGSPGMPGTKREEWIIYSVNHDGSYDEFMRI